MSDGYNGWKNYETWNANLWMDNDGMTEHWQERAAELVTDDGDRDVTCQLADEIKQWIEDNRPEVPVSMYLDLLLASISEIDTYEIAEHYISDAEGTAD